MSILFVSSDLTLFSKLSGVASRNGWKIVAAADVTGLADTLDTHCATAVVLDLTLPGIDPAVLLPQLRAVAQPPVAIIAYGPHVHRAKLSAALDAGCDAVYSRGQFDAEMESILAGYLDVEPPA